MAGTDDEYLGFGHAPSKPGTFAMMCHAVSLPHAGKGSASRLIVLCLFPDAPRLTLSREDEWVRLSLMTRTVDPDHFLSESLLRSGIDLQLDDGQRIRLESASFSYANLRTRLNTIYCFHVRWSFRQSKAACCFTAAT